MIFQIFKMFQISKNLEYLWIVCGLSIDPLQLQPDIHPVQKTHEPKNGRGIQNAKKDSG